MERDTILIIEGGAMSGVFAAGVLTAFYKKDVYPELIASMPFLLVLIMLLIFYLNKLPWLQMYIPDN